MHGLPAVVTAACYAALYASVLLALGSLLLIAWMRWPDVARGTVLRQGRIASLAAATAYVAVALSAAGGSAGFAAALGIPGALLAWWGLGRQAPWLPYVAGGLLVASCVVTGHAATAAPVRFMAPSVAAHVVAAAFWFAALWPLANATRVLPAAESGVVLDAFAARAAGVLIILMVSGLVLTLVQVGVPRNLATTGYGVLLSLKLAAVLVLLWLAARNNVTHTPALRRGDGRSAVAFRSAVRSELVLMCLATALAGALSVATPPRTAGQPLPAPAAPEPASIRPD